MAQGHSFNFFGPYNVQAGRSLCVLFGTGLEFQFSLLLILFAAPVAARWTSLETIFLAVAMAQ